MTNPYETCPIFENENYCLKFVDASDAEDLLRVYSDEKAVPFFNSDNCNGDDFYYTSLERMQEAIAFWQREYEKRYYVRWSIFDKNAHCAVGTIELFHRKAEDFFNACGLLRLDLRSDYEQEAAIFEILSLIIPQAFALFECEMLATKVPPFATERMAALARFGFAATPEKLIGGHDKRAYGDYSILQKVR